MVLSYKIKRKWKVIEEKRSSTKPARLQLPSVAGIYQIQISLSKKS